MEFSATDIAGLLNGVAKELTGREAQIFQHETDHLDGVAVNVAKRGAAVSSALPGRNDPCPCGSGRKFKKCCLMRP